ncbi:unnamed protein product [Spirodela intermedia]|uniref:Uncharacterized protein n=1 Tax=Spirodela intermedia TaxID=51605 RepID=A0A7I8KLB6_SPIIN|nr:unnamed protein product [Spirodela intermedia]
MHRVKCTELDSVLNYVLEFHDITVLILFNLSIT